MDRTAQVLLLAADRPPFGRGSAQDVAVVAVKKGQAQLTAAMPNSALERDAAKERGAPQLGWLDGIHTAQRLSMAIRLLRILVVSNKHNYGQTPFRRALEDSSSVAEVHVVRYVGSARSMIKSGRVNVVFIDPQAPTANSFDQAAEFIKDTREQFPEIVFVICSIQSVIDKFLLETGDTFRRFFQLDYEIIESAMTPELKDILHKCQVDYEAKYRNKYKYDIALSFAGEQRKYAEQLAARLQDNGVKVFYDDFEKADIWGKNLYTHLHDVYSNKARYCTVFASREYRDKVWTNHEREAAQERALQEKGEEYILPIRCDDTKIPGLSSNVAYINMDVGMNEICRLALKKFGY